LGKDYKFTSARTGAQTSLLDDVFEAVWWRCHRRIVADYLIARLHTFSSPRKSSRALPNAEKSGLLLQAIELAFGKWLTIVRW
jgi:hypothetical protein